MAHSPIGINKKYPVKLTCILVLLIALFTTSFIVERKSTPLTVLTYLIKEPKVKTFKPPLLILMHGIGSNEKDMFGLANQLSAKFLVVSIRGPYEIGSNGYGWFHADFRTDTPTYNKEEAEKSRRKIIQFITELKQIHSFDQSKVYLCGFSQGGVMAYNVGLSHPDVIKGIAVMSGRLLDTAPRNASKSENAKMLHVFISHGTTDPVISIKNARAALVVLKSLNIKPTYKEYAEGHAINHDMMQDLTKWLNQQ